MNFDEFSCNKYTLIKNNGKIHDFIIFCKLKENTDFIKNSNELCIYNNNPSYYLHPRVFKSYLIYNSSFHTYYSILEEWVFSYGHSDMHYNNIKKIDTSSLVFIKPAQDHSVDTMEKRCEIINEILKRLEK